MLALLAPETISRWAHGSVKYVFRAQNQVPLHSLIYDIGILRYKYDWEHSSECGFNIFIKYNIVRYNCGICWCVTLLYLNNIWVEYLHLTCEWNLNGWTFWILQAIFHSSNFQQWACVRLDSCSFILYLKIYIMACVFIRKPMG